MNILNRKYPTGLLLPVSLQIHLTNCVNQIYGSRLAYPERGLSTKCCDEGERGDNDCVWNALSAVVDVQADGAIAKRNLKCRKGRTEKRIAKRLKVAFKKWFSKMAPDSHINLITERGFNSVALPYLEQFFGNESGCLQLPAD